MMKRTIISIAIPLALAAGTLNAAEIFNGNGNKVNFYGKMTGEHSWTLNDPKSSNADSSSARLGVKGETQISDKVTGYGQWEVNLSANKPEGRQDSKVRKAFAGFKFGQLGQFDYGRNTGVVYDAQAATDALVSFGGDGWSGTDMFMNGRTVGVATYRNSDFFGLVEGLSFALQYQGESNASSTALNKQNGDGVSASVSYATPIGITLTTAYGSSNRTQNQRADKLGNKAEVAAVSALYDNNNIYAAVSYAQTYNMVPQANDKFANQTQNIEAVVQYQFDFGLRPSLGYVQSKGNDLAKGTTFAGGKADLVKYVEIGAWYYFNKNMNVYAAYKFNLLNKNEYTSMVDLSTANEAAVGVTYQF